MLKYINKTDLVYNRKPSQQFFRTLYFRIYERIGRNIHQKYLTKEGKPTNVANYSVYLLALLCPQKNLSLIKESYHDLELKISKFSQELPKIEGQIDILEAFANTIEGRDSGWDPKTHLTLPNVDVYLNKFEHGKNTSRKCSKHLPKDS